MSQRLDKTGLDLVFLNARSIQHFTDKRIDDSLLRELYDLLKLGPTGFNSQPARYLFIRSADAKRRLAATLSEGNREKTLRAPLNIVVAWDSRFHEHLPEQFPAYDAKAFFDGAPDWIEPTARTNATLQAAYLIIAARALGLDVGPMSGFKPELLDREFFPDGRHHSLLLANIGYGERDRLAERGPRLGFEQVVELL